MNQVAEMPNAMNAPLFGAFVAAYVVLVIALVALEVVAFWRIFEKAGEPGWKALIPIYSDYMLYRIGWDVRVFWITLILGLLCMIPLLGIVAAIVASVLTICFYVKLAKAFGHGGWFSVGLFLLSPIFILILAFDKSEYLGPQK